MTRWGRRAPSLASFPWTTTVQGLLSAALECHEIVNKSGEKSAVDEITLFLFNGQQMKGLLRFGRPLTSRQSP